MAKDKKEKKEKKSKDTAPTTEIETDTAATTTTTPSEPSHTHSKATADGDVDASDLYDSQLLALSAIARPLASKKLNKKVLKTVKKAALAKHVRRGVKEVVKALRKGEKGMVILAGDISPIDVISHIPVLCEDQDVPYIYTPSKESLGTAGATKRPTSCIMIVPGGKKKDMDAAKPYLETFQSLAKEIEHVDESMAI